ncbi:MAG: SulP family inorganic anion transporter [Sphingobacteriia bacterium]|nr:SulP family inorganic anion transporter [Sphingobacteriia bacterium]
MREASMSLLPKTGLAGLKQNWRSDLLSGFLVFLIALPLCLGISMASGFPPSAGIITAIIGGVLVSRINGSYVTINGPAAGLIVVVLGAVQELGQGDSMAGYRYTLAAIVVASALQILLGVVKAGRLSAFFPASVVHGMLAAIGIIIMAKQLHLLLGINPAELKGKAPLELLAMLPSSIMHENAHLTEIGIACLAILVLMSYVKHEKLKKIPAPLVVLAVSIPLGLILHIKTDGAIANFALVKIGSISDAFKNGFVNVDFSGLMTHTSEFIQFVILYALIGSIESLLTAKAVDGMDQFKRKTDFDKDLIGVGIGNTLCGIIGGLPMISEVARSSANVSNGARTRWANFFHGLFLLLAVLFAVPFIEMIPNVALAAMLVFVGFRLAHPRQFIHTLHIGRDQLLVFSVTILVTISTDLLLGVGSGIVLELVINLLNGARVKNLFKSQVTVSQKEGIYTVLVKEDLIFSNLLGFKKQFATIPAAETVRIDFSEATIVDHTCIVTINTLVEDYKDQGGTITIVGFDHHKQLSKDPTSTRIHKIA